MARRQFQILSLLLVSLSVFLHSADALAPTRAERTNCKLLNEQSRPNESESPYSASVSRRNVFQQAGIASATLVLSSIGFSNPLPAQAAADTTLDSYLYKIVRVLEATQQEQRLIKTGKFKDMQRANVKLAIKFMVQNYRLSDCVVGASSFLKGGNSQQMAAIDTGQMAVQNLQTILEYFDSSDVENIKVGKNSMSGKEEIVVKGLEATKIKLEQFLSYFDEADVTRIKAQVQEENDLNLKEFDKSLGDIINLKPIV